MIIDANDPITLSLQPADICIIGSGAAGITIALELIDSGLNVVLIESGNFKSDAKTQALYKGSVADENLHSPPDKYRQRSFGGSTAIWGGRCMPFDPIDFEFRPDMPESGWPFSIDALTPYYPRANKLCEAGSFEYVSERAFEDPIDPIMKGFQNINFSTNTLERFSCPTNFGKRYVNKLANAKNIRVVLNCNVTSIELATGTKYVDYLNASTLSGKRFRISARKFIIAAGGLETTRLLLASRSQKANGIGNEFDQVGRYYMCHIAGTIGTLRFHGGGETVHHGYDISKEGIYCRQRIALKPALQRNLGIGNFIARLHHPRITNPDHGSSILSLLFLAKHLIPYEYAKRLHDGVKVSTSAWFKHIRNVIFRPFDAISFALHILRDRKLSARKFPSIIIKSPGGIYSIDFHAEQAPNPASRVTINPNELDHLGMPKLHIDWRHLPKDEETVKKALALLAKDILESGIGELEYSEDEVIREITRYGAYGGHHIGTTRMGKDPERSVVDPNCRVHSTENLYIASSSVFPTSSQANPTLTIVALSLRLANHIKYIEGLV